MPIDDLCPACGSANRAGAKFCSECGQRIGVGEPILADAMPAASGPGRTRRGDASGERRQLTVMCYDLVDSTAIATELDPEDLREVIAAFHRCITDEVERFGGFVARYIGDGALAYFGYPRANENDPERAIAAGLATIEAVSRLSLHGRRPRVRIGIATGLVVIGDIAGVSGYPEHDIAGGTPNLAVRLQALAEPGSIVISSMARRLVGNLFRYSDLGEQRLKGFAEPQRLWQVIGKGPVDSRFEARHDTGRTKLVGRRRELAVLLRAWRWAKEGNGRVVLLAGEAGIGKSRIASVLSERLCDDPHVRLRYFCSPHQQESPLAPCIGHIERAAGLQREDTGTRKLEKLAAILPAEDRRGPTVALLADLLSIPLPDGYPAPQLTPQQRRARTLDVLVRQLEQLSRGGPVLAIFEDVHWIDPTSAELLERAAGRVADLPVLLLVTARPEYHAPWGDQPHVMTLTLGPLSRDQAQSIVEDLAGDIALPGELLDEIVVRADGVPLFLEELTKAIVESGRPHGAREMISADSAPRDTAVPTTLHASLLARLDHLGPAKEVAQIGAVIGREFSLELLARVAHMDQAELLRGLGKLSDAGLLFRRGGSPGTSFVFKHALVQEIAYSTLLRSSRRQLHARVVESLESMFPNTGPTPPELLAHHCTEAGLVWKGALYWLMAGQQSLARSAMTEATAQLRRGLDVLGQTPRTDERNRCELEFQIALGKVLIATKGHAAPVTGQVFARARELCDLLQEPAQIISALHGQWTHALLRAELASARRRARELLRLGQTRGELLWQVMGYRCIGVTSYPLGEFQAAREYLDRGLELFEPDLRSAFRQWTVDDVQIVMMYYSSWTLLYLGCFDQARRRCDAALAEARRLDQPFTLAHALIAATLTRLVLQEYEEAQALLTEVLALAEENGIQYFTVVGNLFRGRCLAELQCPREAIEVLTRSLAIYRASGSRLYLPTFLAYLAVAHAKAGQPRQALEQIEEVAGIVEATDTRCDEADMYRLKGEFLASIGSAAAAEQAFCKALAVARRQSAKLWELRAANSLAELWSERGRRDEARKLVLSVRDRFTEGFDTRLLGNAEAIIGRLG